MIEQSSIEVSKKQKIKLVFTEIFMIVVAIIWFIPIYYLIVTTFKSPQEAEKAGIVFIYQELNVLFDLTV